MTAMQDYPAGTFNWVDLATSDADAAMNFYGDLFDWSFDSVPIPGGGSYSLAKVKDHEVAGLFLQGEDQAGIPPHWNSYIKVDAVDDSAVKCVDLGATVVAEPFEVMEAGRMAVIQDPTGAMFMLWQPNQHPGAGLVNEPVTLCWNELLTRDPGAASTFYTSMFGWSAETDHASPYTFFKNGDRAAGGMMPISDEMGDVPPHWGVYFAVADCDATCEKATSSGAQIYMGPQDIPEIGRSAVLADPQGAVFSVITLENPD